VTYSSIVWPSKILKTLQFPWMFSPSTCSQSPLGKHGLNFPSHSRSWIILFFSPKSKWDMRSTNLLSLAKCTQIRHLCGKHLTSLYLQSLARSGVKLHMENNIPRNYFIHKWVFKSFHVNK
jgi:hypothetical protein